MITLTHRIYQHYPAFSTGVVSELDDVLPIVRKYWPESNMQGSAGLARCFLHNETRLLVAYTWGVRRRGTLTHEHNWKYMVFKEGHEW